MDTVPSKVRKRWYPFMGTFSDIKKYTTTYWISPLGYLFEHVVTEQDKKELADIWHDEERRIWLYLDWKARHALQQDS